MIRLLSISEWISEGRRAAKRTLFLQTILGSLKSSRKSAMARRVPGLQAPEGGALLKP